RSSSSSIASLVRERRGATRASLPEPAAAAAVDRFDRGLRPGLFVFRGAFSPTLTFRFMIWLEVTQRAGRPIIACLRASVPVMAGFSGPKRTASYGNLKAALLLPSGRGAG